MMMHARQILTGSPCLQRVNSPVCCRPAQRKPARGCKRVVVNVLEKEPPAVPSSEPELAAVAAPSTDWDKPSPPVRSLTLTPGPGQVLVFSYGANLALSTLKRRGCQPHSRYPAAVVDQTVKLVFKHRGGYSTLQQLQPGEAAKFPCYLGQVHGVLYEFGQEDLKRLVTKEGGYQLVDIEVETYDGWRATAKAFVSGPLAQLQAEVIPTEKYMKQLRDGAADNYLDPLYQAWLSSIETVPSVGLGAEYYDTPAKYIAYSFLAIVALVVVGFFSQH